MAAVSYFKLFSEEAARQYREQLVEGLRMTEELSDADDNAGVLCCDLTHIESWSRTFPGYPRMSRVIVPATAQVVRVGRKFRTNELILEDVPYMYTHHHIWWDPVFCMSAVCACPINLKNCWAATPEICEVAVRQSPLMIKYVYNQSRELCALAVSNNGYAIEYVRAQTRELCAIAVQCTPWALEYVREPSKDVRMIAVSQDWRTLRFVPDPDLDLCMAALQQSTEAWALIPRDMTSIIADAIQVARDDATML